MKLAAPLLALLLLAPALADAATSVRSAGASVVRAAAPVVPLALSRGAAGTATIGANATASSDAMTGGVGSTISANSTRVQNAGGTDFQVRLVFRTTVGGATSQCTKCDLQIRNATTTTAEINVDGSAPASGTAGPWVTLKGGESCWIWALGQATLIADTVVVVDYTLEIQPLAGGGIVVRYMDMQQAYTV